MNRHTDTDKMCENSLNSQDVVSDDDTDSDDGDMLPMRRRLRMATAPLMETTYSAMLFLLLDCFHIQVSCSLKSVANSANMV